MSMALFSPPTHFPSFTSCTSAKPLLTSKPPHFSIISKKAHFFISAHASSDNGAGGIAVSAVVVDPPQQEAPPAVVPEKEESVPVVDNGVPPAAAAASAEEDAGERKFEDPKWVNGTWDLNQFQKNGSTDWDAVIDAEVRRRKWFQDNPESSSNDNPIVFDTSLVPWWAWMKRFHLPEAEVLNGRAAMVGFFMAYFVDSLTGVGLVDQMGNFFCKTLLFVAVAGVLLVRKNEDIENLKKLLEETTFYDKQWQATWQDENADGSKKN